MRVIIAVALLVLAAAPAASLTHRPPEPTCALVALAFIGPACERPDGLIDIYTSNGSERLMTTHGFDGAAEYPSPAVLNATPVPPVCVEGSPLDRYGQVVYVVSSDQTDRYVELLPQLRAVVNQTNGDLHATAAALGGSADYKMKCEDGLVVVKHVVLTNPTNETGVTEILQGAMDQGALSPQAKNWIYYDDATHHIPYHGMGSFCGDDRVVLANCNNGGGMFALSFGYVSDFVFMHEVGHNLGAVVLSAPHTSGGAHCNDGLDVMCYADHGGLSNYSNSSCAEYEWDCGHDDYFDPAPAAGSFLATHWNLASRLDRFLRIGPEDELPQMVELRCDTNETAWTCSFAATSPTNALRYVVEWPDGTSDTVPANGDLPSGAEANLAHGAPTDPEHAFVQVRAMDASGRTSEGTTWGPSLVPPNEPPRIVALSCPDQAAAWAIIHCSITTSDDGWNVSLEWDDHEGNVFHSGWVAPGARPFWLSFANNETQLERNVTVAVTLRDDGQPALSDSAIKSITVLSQPPPCLSWASGSLLFGLPGQDSSDLNTATIPIDRACWDHDYTLSGSPWADLDICFDNELGQILCSRHTGSEAGAIPEGTTRARVILTLGAVASYDFEPEV